MTKSITENKFIVSLNEEGYYELYIKDNFEIFIEDIVNIKEAQKQISGKVLPVLISGGKYSITNIEVMQYVSKNKNMPYTKISAYITSSTSQKLLGNFYLKMNKPERPTRFFNNREEAVNWIKEYL